MKVTDDDPDLRAMQAALRRKRLVWIGLVIGGLVLGALYPFEGMLSVRSSLEGEGYTDVEVKLKGYFTYGFTGKKGNDTCAGTIVRFPMSSSRSEGCFGVE